MWLNPMLGVYYTKLKYIMNDKIFFIKLNIEYNFFYFRTYFI